MGGQYHVTRIPNGYVIGDVDQPVGGMTFTDAWLREMGFWPLTKLNVRHVVNAGLASRGGMILSPHKQGRIPRDNGFVPGFRNYPATPTKGRLPRNKVIRGD